MKKETLLKLILNTKNLKDSILLNLHSISELTEEESERFCDVCISNDEFFERETLEYILDLYYNLSFLQDDESKSEVIDIISELINNDYVKTSEDFNEILSTIGKILFLSTSEIIDCDIENEDYYKIYMIKKYTSLYNNLLCNDLVIIQDYELYSNKFIELLYDLKNTSTNNTEDFTDKCLSRIDGFVSIASDKEILNLDSEKYKYILSVALNIKEVKELYKFKGRVKKVSEEMSLDEFRWYLEQYTEFVNDNTIDLIFHELNLNINVKEDNTKELIKDSSKNEDEVLRKILSPKKNNIIKM